MKYLTLLLLLLLPTPADAQTAIPYHFLTAATTNANVVVAGTRVVDSILAVNTVAAIYYLKLYDKATAPVCNTDPVVYTAPVPFAAGSAGGGVFLPFPNGLRFQNGVAFCLTGGLADNDNTNAVVGVVISFGIK